MKAPSIITAAPVGLTEADLCAWLGAAVPGQRLVYHRGVLATDVTANVSRLTEPERKELARVARRALAAEQRGLACLIQQRHGVDDYSYVIVACRRPRPKSDASVRLRSAAPLCLP